ncbi:hypothetical protein B0G80_5351 [Paraburkholderia sp. BL6669N2]|uniref:hypothetical protein n=1 Tax=Paraburkholderia sp. BL6669N2 TaxID=1938807 RepID=UPI000E23DF2D|nr:hypothetical protein [Paraburkholderia sp. BL6669N2]REG49028.1 hypothetical protein B0G80_5351 [Paraburkholderia sp. BL6669N2]
MLENTIIESVSLLVTLFAVVTSFLWLQIKHPGAIRVISYVFSLAFWATTIIFLALIATKQIGKDGVPLGPLGKFLRTNALPFFFDVSSDFFFVTAIASLVILPQIFSYMFCGIFGCARAPIWISGSIDLMFWGIAKSFSVAAGVLASFTLFCILGKWTFSLDFVGKIPGPPFLRGVSVVVNAFFLTLYYVLLSVLPLCARFAELPFHLPRRIIIIAEQVHQWAIRHNPEPTFQDVSVSFLLKNLDDIRLLCEAAAREYNGDSAEAGGARAAQRD